MSHASSACMEATPRRHVLAVDSRSGLPSVHEGSSALAERGGSQSLRFHRGLLDDSCLEDLRWWSVEVPSAGRVSS